MANPKTSTGLDENVEAALTYLLGPITGILFLVLEKENKFVRFHALQSTVTFGALAIVYYLISFIPFVNILYSLACIGLLVFMIVKAYYGEKYKLPIAGDIAEKHI